MRKIAIFCIRCYQLCISPLLGSNCRFYPSCSHYACEAFRKKTFFKALWLVIKRLLKCGPWNEGGYDPIE